MPTAGNIRCSELDVVVDLIDAMEVCLYLGYDVAQEEQKLQLWRDEVEFIKRTKLTGWSRVNAALAATHELGAELYIASLDWPKGDALESDTQEREAVKYDLKEQVANNIAHYSMSAYTQMIENSLHCYESFAAPKALKTSLLLYKFSNHNELQEAQLQEFYGLCKLKLSELTGGEIKAPGPRELFDPSLTAIERHWHSPTRLDTTISYDGQVLGRFKDDIFLHPMGHIQPKMTEADAVHSARDAFYHGQDQHDLGPINVSSTHQMYMDVLKGCNQALSWRLTDEQRMIIQEISEEAKALWPTVESESLPAQSPHLNAPSI